MMRILLGGVLWALILWGIVAALRGNRSARRRRSMIHLPPQSPRPPRAGSDPDRNDAAFIDGVLMAKYFLHDDDGSQHDAPDDVDDEDAWDDD